jgi:ribonuclease M5
MIKLKQAVVVEGKYDKIRLSNILDAVIITTDGFNVCRDKEKLALIRFYAERGGIIILTDSDTAGFKIRSYIKSAVGNKNVMHIYIPDVFGKEKRKRAHSKEGKLGVEGIKDATLAQLFIDKLSESGLSAENSEVNKKSKITTADLFITGLSGTPDAQSRRRELLHSMGLPELISSNGLLDILNNLYNREDFLNKFLTEE